MWSEQDKILSSPAYRFHPSCPCHPLTLDTGGKTPGPPCIPFSPAMLNCPTMKATPPVMACPDDLPQNPCCISEGRWWSCWARYLSSMPLPHLWRSDACVPWNSCCISEGRWWSHLARALVTFTRATLVEL